ncbi:hypothetical protein K8I85_18335 [bacterium]|nr:hypothetical protein [bacterium]
MPTTTPRLLTLAAICIALPASAAHAQLTPGSLWPHADQAAWQYEFSFTSLTDPDYTAPATLRFNGTVLHHGHTLQVLEASHDVPAGTRPAGPDLPPLPRAVWQARPDLRDAIERRYALVRGGADWRPSFLHGGYFQENPTSLQMWQPSWDHPTWTYLQTPVAVGESFTHQLLPEFTDDVFLHGTVESIDATVATLAGTFLHAVKMSYVIDYGVGDLIDPDTGVLLGTYHAESQGHVHFVPDVGPVALYEEFYPYLWADCGTPGCPPEIEDLVGVPQVTYSLSLTEAPTAVEGSSWAATKALFR